MTPYELVARSQAGAEDLLREIRALAQIDVALVPLSVEPLRLGRKRSRSPCSATG